MPTLNVSESEANQILGPDKQRALAVARSVVRRARALDEAARRSRAPGPPYAGGPAEGPSTFTDTDGTVYPRSDAGFPSPRDPAYHHPSIAAARAAHPSAYNDHDTSDAPSYSTTDIR